MSQHPKVSIVIPVYNRENLIKETIESALSQTYEDYEVVIVDNCSTDQTFEVIKETVQQHNKVRIFRNECNVGPVPNWKKCIKYADGEYIKILWSDDLIASDFLEITVPILENHFDIGFVYSKAQIFSDKQKFEEYRLGKSGEYQAKIFLEGTLLGKYSVPVSPGCALFRKKDIVIYDLIPNGFGLKHEKNGAGIDLLIFLEVLNRYKKFYYVDTVLSYFRAHKNSFSVANDLSKEYLTAKIFYLKKYNKKAYIKLFNAEIFFKDCFLQKQMNNKNRILNQYYMEPDESRSFTQFSSIQFLKLLFYKTSARIKCKLKEIINSK